MRSGRPPSGPEAVPGGNDDGRTTGRDVLVVSGEDVSLEQFIGACRGRASVVLSDDPVWHERIERGHRVLLQAIAAGRAIYGVNTGFGYSSYRRIPSEAMGDLARSLVKLAGMTRSLKESGLAEGASTRLLIQTGQLVMDGIDIHTACRAALIEPLSDDPELLAALQEMVSSIF